jgi:Transposase DDE domain
LTAARARQRDPSWRADYRATRPKVERKLAHLLRRRHGGRRARVRGLVRVGQDFKLLAAAVNLAASPPSGCTPRPTAGRSSPPDGGNHPAATAGTCQLNAQNAYNSSENTGHLALARTGALPHSPLHG